MKKNKFELIVKKGEETIYCKKNLSQLAVDILIEIENVLNAELKHEHCKYYKLLSSGIIAPLTEEEVKRLIKKSNSF